MEAKENLTTTDSVGDEDFQIHSSRTRQEEDVQTDEASFTRAIENSTNENSLDELITNSTIKRDSEVSGDLDLEIHSSDDVDLEIQRCGVEDNSEQKGVAEDYKGNLPENDRLRTKFNSFTAKSKSEIVVCLPSPSMTKNRRKTIINTFCLTARADCDKESYQLYQETISSRGKEL